MSMLVICGYCLYSINYECLCEKVVLFRLLFLILEFSLISQFMINYPDFLLRPKN